MSEIRVDDIRAFLGDRVLADRPGPAESVTGTASLSPGAPGCITFASRRGEAAQQAVASTAAALVLVLAEHLDSVPGTAGAIVVADPRLEYARVVQEFFAPRRPIGVHASAVIDDSAVIGADASIGPCVVIEAGVRIGDRVTLGPHVVIGERSVLGDDVTIGSGSVVGQTGFGYAREADGTPVLIPHHGAVRIGDRVEIGANTAVDRGTINDTFIDDDAKIDNLVHIAHNCHIGKGAFVIATAILCGGVHVGDGAWIAPNASVLEQVDIGDNAVVGLSATVIKPVEAGTTVVGSPARPITPRS